jgi:hypothetical protein
VLRREKHGQAWRYWPAELREDHDARLMVDILRSGGNDRLTLLRFLNRVSPDELDAISDAMDRPAPFPATAAS